MSCELLNKLAAYDIHQLSIGLNRVFNQLNQIQIAGSQSEVHADMKNTVMIVNNSLVQFSGVLEEVKKTLATPPEKTTCEGSANGCTEGDCTQPSVQ